MKLWEVVKSVGSGIIRELPGGDLALDVVNAVLPSDKKLPAGATGSDIENAVMNLPADQRAELLNKEVDVKIEHLRQQGDTTRAMLEAEKNSTHTSRPKIARQASTTVCFAIITIVTAWAIAVLKSDEEMLTAVSGSWEIILVLLGAPIAWLNSYFGVLKTEHKNRLDAAQGRPTESVGSIAGVVGSLLRRK